MLNVRSPLALVRLSVLVNAYLTILTCFSRINTRLGLLLSVSEDFFKTVSLRIK